MSKTDIIEAYEAGLITRGEAAEQGLVDNLDALYEASAGASEWRRRDRQVPSRRHVGG